ncbi:hypothetical protein CHS0354_023648 [Potamilus streckersoni]|uniref:DZIP3-like HEPN domain-containing protein n=1 Tax=Potamilus streckersoni TaxID=2493646 RepID=A0AAE0SZ77_9BIVA|nr:hypothetical protein CHS0354_023648 [Potamilus streckersoni]
MLVDKVISSVKTEMPPSVPDPENSEDEKQDDNASDIITSDKRKPAFEETSIQIVQDIPIEQIVEESLNQAEIQMDKEERDLFLRLHEEIGTTLHFSKDPQTLIDVQKSLQDTEMFIEQSHPDMKDEWLEYKNQGKLTPELIDVFCAEERNRKLHIYKYYFLNKMEKLNILIRGRSFNENGVKEEDFYFTPCMLRKEAPREVIAPKNDVHMVSTSVLCWVIIGKFLMPEIFQKLIVACLARWPVAKKKKTSENLIFQNCTVFDLDPVHRLFLHFENHTVFARITRMGIDDIINAKSCTRVRKFITRNLSETISHLDPKLKYRLCVQNAESQDIPEDIRSYVSPPFEMWFADKVHDPNAPITREHMNLARLCVAMVTICGKAMRDILQANVPAPHTNINEAILANKTKLIGRTENGSGKGQNSLLNKDQCKLLFTDPKHQHLASIDQFDISLLYTLIRNLSKVQPPSTNWGVAPQDRPWDKSVGANVERIHTYRNELCGHSVDGEISQDDFEDYWKKLVLVLSDLDNEIGQQEYCQELDKQKRQVMSVYEAC